MLWHRCLYTRINLFINCEGTMHELTWGAEIAFGQLKQLYLLGYWGSLAKTWSRLVAGRHDKKQNGRHVTEFLHCGQVPRRKVCDGASNSWSGEELERSKCQLSTNRLCFHSVIWRRKFFKLHHSKPCKSQLEHAMSKGVERCNSALPAQEVIRRMGYPKHQSRGDGLLRHYIGYVLSIYSY